MNNDDIIMDTEKTYTYTTTNDKAGMRLDIFLAGAMPDVSRSKVKKLIDSGFVNIGGRKVRAHQSVRAGDVIHVIVPPAEKSDLAPEDIPLSIIYEDEWIVVVDKPAGIVVHPAAGNSSHTIVNALLGRYKNLSSGTHPLRPGIVHRLDKDTSGCLIVAKDDVTHRRLTELFSGRKVKKEYRSIVSGNVSKDKGIIQTMISRSRHDRKKMAVTGGGGRESETGYTVIERYGPATYIQAFPKTGRTHQIRVHMSHIGNPVLGDEQYSRRRSEKALGIKVSRHMLHAYGISFVHPVTGKDVEFESPLPDDFLSILESLRKTKSNL